MKLALTAALAKMKAAIGAGCDKIDGDWISKQPQPPDDFYCPITYNLMVDPVILYDHEQPDNPNLGQSYEKRAIEHHLDSGGTICPKSNIRLIKPFILNNWTLQACIASYQYSQEVWRQAREAAASIPSQRESQLFQFASIAEKTDPSQEDLEELARLTASKYEEVQQAAVKVVDSLRKAGNDNMGRLAEAGAAQSVIQLLMSNKCSVQVCGGIVVNRLAYHAPTRALLYGADVIPALMQLLKSKDDHVLGAVAWAVVNMSVDIRIGMAIAQAGIIPLLVQMLTSTTENILCATLGAVRNISAAQPDSRWAAAFKEAGAIPLIVRLLHFSKVAVQEKAVWAVRNMADDSDCCVAFTEAGAATLLVDLLNTSAQDMQSAAARAVRKIANAQESCALALKEAGSIPPLVQLLQSDALDVQEQAAWAVKAMASNMDDDQAFVDAGVIEPLVQLLGSSEHSVQVAAAWAVSKVARYTDACVAFEAAGAMPLLAPMLRSPVQFVRDAANPAARELKKVAGHKARLTGTNSAGPSNPSNNRLPGLWDLFTCINRCLMKPV